MSRWTISVDSAGNKSIIGVNGARPYRWYHGLVDWCYLQRDLFLSDWAAQQKLSRKRHARFYGDGGTIHHSTYLDIEVFEGRVVSVWFRCQPLAFKVRRVSKDRADEMRRAALERGGGAARLTGVEVALTPDEK